MALRFVDQEPDEPLRSPSVLGSARTDRPTTVAGLYSPNNPAPLTPEQSNAFRQRWLQQQLELENNSPPSIDPSQLAPTHEMTPAPYYPGQDLDRDDYIQRNPQSGIG